MNKIVAASLAAAIALAAAVFVGASFAGDGDHGKSAQAPGQTQSQPPGQASSTIGVKPSNDTQKDTHAQAGSNKTKLYGNGKTAGQIVISKGASPTTDLHGPGNSQPHKVVRCPNGHEVDVHAHKSGASCGSQFNVAAETKTHAKHE